MFYIRFLSIPKSVPHTKQPRWRTIRFVLTLTSDLGDVFDPSATDLQARVLTEASVTLTSKPVQWPAGNRALAVELSFEHANPPPVLIHVHPRQGSTLAHLDLRQPLSTLPGPLPPLMGVVSDKLEWRHGKVVSHLVRRRLDLAPSPPLQVWEEVGDSIARHIWDGSVAFVSFLKQLAHPRCRPDESSRLCDYLWKTNKQHVKAIELGAGCGTVGIAFAQLFTNVSVLLTDLPDAMEVMQRNVQAAKPAAGSVLEPQVLDWEGDQIEQLSQCSFDLVLVSECTYNTDSIPSLIRVIVRLLNNGPDVRVILATKRRHADERIWEDMLLSEAVTKADHTVIPLPLVVGCSHFAHWIDIYVLRLAAGRGPDPSQSKS